MKVAGYSDVMIVQTNSDTGGLQTRLETQMAAGWMLYGNLSVVVCEDGDRLYTQMLVMGEKK